MKRKKITIAVSIILSILIALPFILNKENRELTDEIIQKQKGSVVTLSHGRVYYELKGEKDRPLIIFVHGFSIPSFLYDEAYYSLVNKGYRVLRFDLYGRGFSDRLNKDNTVELFVNQLHELLEKIAIEDNFTLIGHSMGGIIAAQYSLDHTKRVNKLVLVDPLGATSLDESFLSKMIRMPFLGDYLLMTSGHRSLVKRFPINFYKPKDYSEIQKRFSEQLKFKGTLFSLKSTMNNILYHDFKEMYRKIGHFPFEKMLIWGREDASIPVEHSDILKGVIPKLDVHILEECGHSPIHEMPDTVVQLIEKFTNK